MVVAKSLDKLVTLEREYRETAKFANFPESIRAICTFVYFAWKGFLTLPQP